MWRRLWRKPSFQHSKVRAGRIFAADTPAVGAGAVLALLDHVHILGHTPETVLAGLRLDRAALSRPMARISWRTLVCALENLERAGVTPQQFVALGEAMAPSPHLRVGRIMSFFLRPEHLLFVGMRWIGPALFPVLDHDLSYRNGELDLTLTIPDHLPASAAYMHVCAGTFAAIPTVMAQPRADVQATISERSGHYRIRCLRQPLGVNGLSRLARALLSVPSVINTLAEQERELRLSFEASLRWQRQFADMLDALPDGVVVVRPHGDLSEIVYANPALCRILGHQCMGEPSTELTTRDLEELLHPDDRGKSEARLSHADGHWVPCELSSPQDIHFNDSPARLMLVRDVTLRKRLQGQLAVADKMTSLGTMAAGIAHEINNPLALLLANLQLHLSLHGTSPELEAALEGAQRVGAIAGDLSLFSKPDSATPHPVQLAEVIESTVNLASGRISPRASVNVVLQGAPPVLANRGRIGQVLLNLLINALDAFPSNRPVSVNLITLRLSRDADDAIIEVSDNASGIAPEHRAQLFEPFFTTKEPGEGSGLGLAVAHGIVNGYGGSISVASTLGKGTCFRIQLPIASGATSALESRVCTSHEPAHAARVLVIDDERDLLSALCASLELSGHDVVSATSGNAAIELLTDDCHFDAIVCDLTMANGGGVEVHQHLSSVHPKLVERLVFMTGGTFRRDTRAFLETVTNACLEKPFRLEQLDQAVAKLIPVGKPH